MSVTYHEATKHSYWSVRTEGGGLDWSRQPSPFKIYANAPLIPLDLDRPWHRFIYLLGGINASKSYPGITYYLRTIPSAGALYPIEIYFQARGHRDFADGIYHFDVANLGVRLLYELRDGEGVEYLFPDKRQVEGLLFLYSGIYYRSSWKYRTRAFRYLLLDGGHALGALEAAAFWINHGYQIRYRFDRAKLHHHFGFGQGEFFLASGVVGRFSDQEAQGLGMELDFVDGTGHFLPDPRIEEAYWDGIALRGCRLQPRFPQNPFQPQKLEEAILKRRSARDFTATFMKREQLEFLLHYMGDVIPSDCDEEVRIWTLVHRVEGMEPGIYLNGRLVKAGNFAKEGSYLCLEQEFVQRTAATFFLTSSGSNYQPLYQKAGHIGQRCYVGGSYLGLGVSGIGAYYDDEVARFLGTSEMVLYALALGSHSGG
ncbi:MAG: dehydrogenase [Nitratiruptor sp.]|nr:dehydrogenase [Nitratiruptor sp.]NPA83115.1 SagB/ThcOx family dehydrogenase [Campylobacterota bacterium]